MSSSMRLFRSYYEQNYCSLQTINTRPKLDCQRFFVMVFARGRVFLKEKNCHSPTDFGTVENWIIALQEHASQDHKYFQLLIIECLWQSAHLTTGRGTDIFEPCQERGGGQSAYFFHMPLGQEDDEGTGLWLKKYEVSHIATAQALQILTVPAVLLSREGYVTALQRMET